MTDCLSLETARSFAGPLATVFASLVAAGFAFAQYRVAKAQKDIAKSQSDIALEKLKSDLFGKRYEIYVTTKKLLERIINNACFEKQDSMFIRDSFIKMDEARFFFGVRIRWYLSQIEKTCNELFNLHAERNICNVDDRERWSGLADSLADKDALLQKFLRELPAKFEDELSFKKITQSS
jgi:molybdopterin converting factor small subunit